MDIINAFCDNEVENIENYEKIPGLIWKLVRYPSENCENIQIGYNSVDKVWLAS